MARIGNRNGPTPAGARKILVTGGCGFVGAAVAEAFADAGHDVTVVDLNRQPFQGDVTCVHLDITDAAGLIDVCAGMDTVVHAASIVQTRTRNRDAVWRVNHGGTRNVMAACERHAVARLIHISSASVVYAGRDIEGGDERLPYAAVSQSPYAESKIAAEREVLAFDGSARTRTCAIRPHLVFGPGDNRFVPNVVRRAAAGRLTREIGRREKLSDFTYIDNLVDAITAAADALVAGSPLCGQAYFITNGEPTPFFGFVEGLLKQLGYPPIRGRMPYWLAYAGAAAIEWFDTMRLGAAPPENGVSRFSVRYLATHHYFDIGKAHRDFGWKPRVSLAEGIRLTVDETRKCRPTAPETGQGSQ